MKVIYSTQAVVQFDGKHYYSNAVQSTYKRYKVFNGRILCICYMKCVKKGTEDMVDDDALDFVVVSKLNTLFNYIRYSKRNKKIVEDAVKNADVCIAHIPASHSYDVIKYAKKYNVPYMTVVVGCCWDSMWNYNWKGKLMAPFCYLAQRKAQRYAPFSIYVTNQFLQSRYPTTGESIGCSNVNLSTGVLGVLEKRLSKIRERKPNSTIKIGTAAALDVPYKGQIYVIRALGELKKKGIVFEYHLVGGGTGAALRKEAVSVGVESQVKIRGRIPHEEITNFLDDIDIYIQPSKQEGLPRATIEAMSRGCLCLGSNIAGIPELLENRFLFTKGSVSEIVDILSNISNGDYEKQAVRNYEIAKEYDINILNKRRTEFINRFKAITIK